MRIKQLGLFLATAGASLLLSGAAHADAGDVTSASQTNQTSASQQVVVNDQSSTTSSVKTTQTTTGQTSSGTPPSITPAATVTPEANSSLTPVPPTSSDENSAPATGAQPTGESTYTPVPIPATFFRPVTIIVPLIPTVSRTGGVTTVIMPVVQPALPAVPALPAPTGAFSHVTQALGQTIMPMGGSWTLLSSVTSAWPVPLLSLGLLAFMAAITFASLLRRWGYAISARGSDSHLQLVYEFASPAMSELVPVRTMYPG